MTSEPKAFASLSSGLLARKGSARPAMRPQGFGQAGSSLDDLGWNDMGHEPQRPALVPVGNADGAGVGEPVVNLQLSRTPLAGLTPASPVHDQQAEIEERFGQGEPVMQADDADGQDVHHEVFGDEDALELSNCLPDDASASSAEVATPAMPSPPVQEQAVAPIVRPAAPKRIRAPRAEAVAKDKAAFTLRLDPNRHLKLRLACAVNAKSAQQLVTKALDELLSSMPELEAMASQAPERASRKG